MSRRVATVFTIFMESRESCLAADGRAWKVDGRAQALVGPGLATPLDRGINTKYLLLLLLFSHNLKANFSHRILHAS